MNNSDFSKRPEEKLPDGIKAIRIRLTPPDLFIMLISLIAFTVIGFLNPIYAAAAAAIISPMFAAFTRKLGGLFPVVIPVISLVSALLLALTAQSSFTLLVNIPFAAVCSYIIAACSTRHAGSFKTSAIFGLSIAAIIWLLSLFALTLFELDMSARHYVKLASEQYDSVQIPLLAESFRLIYGDNYSDQQLISMASQLVFQTKLMIPAYISFIAMLWGYISVCLYKLFVKLFGAGKTLSEVNFSITMSKVAAVAYLIVTLCLIFSSGATAYGLQNVTSILTPGFFIYGLKNIKTFIDKMNFSAVMSRVLIVAVAVVALWLGQLTTSVVVVFGLNYAFSYDYKKFYTGGDKG